MSTLPTGTSSPEREYPYVEPDNSSPPLFKPTEDNRIAHVYTERGQAFDLHNVVDPHPMLGGDKLSRVAIETKDGEFYELTYNPHEAEATITRRWPIERGESPPTYTYSQIDAPDLYQNLAQKRLTVGKPFEFTDPTTGDIVTTGEVNSFTAVSQRQYATDYLQTRFG